MSGPYRRGRAVLQRVLCTSPSNLHYSGPNKYLQNIISACVKSADTQLAQLAFFSRSLGHTSWQAAVANTEVILASYQSYVLPFQSYTQSACKLVLLCAESSSAVQKCEDQALDVEALQTRRVSGSSASTSSSYTPLPAAAGRTQYRTRHFSSSRDASSAEGPVKDTPPSVEERLRKHSEAQQHRRSRYAAKRASSPDTAAEGSASATSGADEGKRQVRRSHNSFAAKGLLGASSAARARSAGAGDAGHAHSAAPGQQPGHRAGRSRDREAPAEGAKSKRTRQLEAIAAEMLPEDEQKEAQLAAPQKQRPAGQLKFPE